MKAPTGKRTHQESYRLLQVRQFMVLGISAMCIILLTSQVTLEKAYRGQYFGQAPPGHEPIPFAKGIIPDDLHSAPIFSSDGNSLYFKPMDNDVVMVMEMNDEEWAKPRPLFISDEISNSDDPCLSPDGKNLFFSAYSKEENREYIYFCSREEGGDCLPQLPAGKLNSLDLHWQFSVAENGNIYFSSNGNIYCSCKVGDAYGEPEKLPPAINTHSSECTPYVSPEEDMIIFSRGNGSQSDLFISYKNAGGNWEKAIPLPDGINTEHHEMCPTLSPDGKYLFFLSSRKGLFSAYWVECPALLLK